jgi:hypothetical protein
LLKHGFSLHRRFDGMQVIAVDTRGGGCGLTSRSREAYQRMTRESLTIDIAALVREGDQHLAYAIERPLRTGYIHLQPHDVPEEK